MSQLLNLQTDLKSLRFGNDRPEGGSSQQPYVKTAIPPQDEGYAEAMNVLGTPIGTGTDALIRGGIASAEHVARDLERIGKWFFDTTSPRGLQFVANQGILAEISVRTQASKGAKPNQGFYSPLQTLYQIGTNNIGGHSNRFLNGLLNPLKQTRGYLDSTGTPGASNITTNFVTDRIIGGDDGSENRLVLLNEIKQLNLDTSKTQAGATKISKALLNNSIQISSTTDILNYQGGPNSILGAGNTQIKFATNQTGAPLRTGINNPKILPYTGNIPVIGNVKGIKIEEIEIQDFRKPKLRGQISSTIMGLAPNYSQKSPGKNYTIEGKQGSRINMRSPGQRGNVIDYVRGKLDGANNPIGAVDKLNALPLYKSGFSIQNNTKNDLVKFRIAAIDTESPGQKVYIHFRAFINNFTDNYQGNWNAVSYMGRGEDFYRYSKFARNINMDFTVAAQSKPEIMEQYKKLNFLVSNAFPDYTKAGYMAGPLIQLTMGGWCYELPGFINSINLDIPQESPWEIGIGINDNPNDAFGGISFRDSTVKEMPHICNVSMQFTPIHRFRPQKQNNTYSEEEIIPFEWKGKPVEQKIGRINGESGGYGSQRYIQLDDGGGNNAYDKPQGNQKFPPLTSQPEDELNINTIDGISNNNLA